MENTEDLEEFAAQLFDHKKVNFYQIKEADFPVEGELVFSNESTTIRRIGNMLYLATKFTGRIKDSFINVHKIERGILPQPIYGRVSIDQVMEYTGYLKPQKDESIHTDRTEFPVNYLAIYHQKKFGTTPVYSAPFPYGDKLSVSVQTKFGKFFGDGVDKKEARKAAADAALKSKGL